MADLADTVLEVIVSGLAGVLFGLALAAPPGPMNAIIAEESVLRDWTAGVWAGLGAMAADVLFCALALLGVATLLANGGVVRPLLYLLGGVLMVAFAVDAGRNAMTASGFTDDGDVAAESMGFRKTFALSLSNPYQIAFWVTVGVGLVSPGTLDVLAPVPLVGSGLEELVVVETGSPLLLVGFFAGIGIWVLAYPAALVAARDRIDALAPLVAAGSAVVLVGFGLLFLWLGAQSVL